MKRWLENHVRSTGETGVLIGPQTAMRYTRAEGTQEVISEEIPSLPTAGGVTTKLDSSHLRQIDEDSCSTAGIFRKRAG